MDFSNLKLFNLGSKEKIVNGIIGFTEKNMWMVDGISKTNPKGKKDNKDLANWWNIFLKENIDYEDDLLELINRGLRVLKTTEYWGSDLAVSLVVVKEKAEHLDLLVIGDCEIILGYNNSISKQIKSYNMDITKSFISRMQEISEKENKKLLETREDIAKELVRSIIGESETSYNLLRCTNENLDIRDLVIDKVKKDTITNITIYNSGVSRYYNTFNIGDIEDLYKTSIDTDYMKIYDKLSTVEQDDIKCEKYPRLKPLKGCMLVSIGV